jgi:hypothetical protein
MCNCKGGKKQIINNLQSSDHIDLAKEVFNNIIQKKTIEEYDDFDNMEILNTYKSLFPNAKTTPTIENAVQNINHAILNYKK